MAAMMSMISVAKTEVHPLLEQGTKQAVLLAEISIAFAKGCADALPGALKNLLDKIPIEAVAAAAVIVLILSAITSTSSSSKKTSKKAEGDSDTDSITSEAEEILEELIDLYVEEHGSEPTEEEFLKWTETLKQATVEHASSPKKGKKKDPTTGSAAGPAAVDVQRAAKQELSTLLKDGAANEVDEEGGLTDEGVSDNSTPSETRS